MLCQNCNKNQANVKYTEIINGEKKEIMLCEECSHKLGIDNISFNMPIDFSSFFGGLLDEEYNAQQFVPLFEDIKKLKCNNCNMSYDEFVSNGKFGCPECYSTFNNKIESLLKRLHGSTEYKGRKALNSNNYKNNITENEKINTNKLNENDKLDNLQNDLKKAIAEERYEDAAKIRDEINSLKGGNK